MNKRNILININENQQEVIKYHVQIRWTNYNKDKSPVVLLHGFAESLETWTEINLELRPIIAIDLLGHGRSSNPANLELYKLDSIVTQLQIVIAKAIKFMKTELDFKFSCEKYHLWGYSLGGRIALAYALLHADKLLSLGLESAGLGIASTVERQERQWQDRELGQKIINKGIAWFAEFWSHLPIFKTQQNYGKKRFEELIERRRQNDPQALAFTLNGMGQGIYPYQGSRLNELTLPLCYVYGELDLPKFHEFAEIIRLKVPQAHIYKIEGVGHNIHWEDPLQLKEVMTDFYTNIERSYYEQV